MLEAQDVRPDPRTLTPMGPFLLTPDLTPGQGPRVHGSWWGRRPGRRVWGDGRVGTQRTGHPARRAHVQGAALPAGAAERRPGERMGRRHGGVSYTRSSWEPARVSSKDLVLGEPLPRGRGGSPETGVTCPLELGHGLGTACRSASLRPTWSVPGPVDFCRAAATQGSRPAGGSRWGRPGGNVTVAAQRGPSALVGQRGGATRRPTAEPLGPARGGPRQRLHAASLHLARRPSSTWAELSPPPSTAPDSRPEASGPAAALSRRSASTVWALEGTPLLEDVGARSPQAGRSTGGP